MRIMLIDNAAGGRSEWIEDVQEGITLGEFFRQVKRGERRENYTLRVNRESVSDDMRLEDGQRVSVIPNKIEGA